jgi:hypothetical protein
MKAHGVKWVSKTLVRSPAYIGICTSERAFHAACRKFGIKPYEWIADDADATMHTWSKQGSTVCVVAVPPRGKRSRATYAALIVHEATHVWQHIRGVLGETKPSSEFEAYSLQNICQELFEAVGL